MFVNSNSARLGKIRAQEWVDAFVLWYNTKHLHSSIQYVTPDSRYYRQDTAILRRRKDIYAAAQVKRPDRWKRTVRSWKQEEATILLARKDFWKKSALKINTTSFLKNSASFELMNPRVKEARKRQGQIRQSIFAFI